MKKIKITAVISTSGEFTNEKMEEYLKERFEEKILKDCFQKYSDAKIKLEILKVEDKK